jgi:EAL domain-containing protein (putative c-di-GMP-specific phosphodiesterase class I)
VDSAASGIDYGAFRYVVKPVSPVELQDTVDKAVQLYRLAWTKRRALELLGVPGGAADRAGLEASFERALSSLWIAFQPIVAAADGSIYGYEALLRSEEPMLPGPVQVVEAAEQLGALHQLGRTIRARASAPMDSTPKDVTLFVNLHPEDLSDPELSSLHAPLSRIADRVVLELTERKSIGAIDDVRAKVETLRNMRFRVAIDDLGAGYAGLTSFALLEPEIVKLDMTLVRDIDSSPMKRKLVASMTALCKEMGMRIVAEGIETLAERDTLVDLGCDLLQGYFFARPGRPFPALNE